MIDHRSYTDNCGERYEFIFLIISFSEVQVYDLSLIHLHSSPYTGAQVVEHCTGVTEVMGSNPVPEFFSGFNFKPA